MFLVSYEAVARRATRLHPIFHHYTHKSIQPKHGVDNGPIHLVNAGLPKQLSELGWKVNFEGHQRFADISVADDPPEGKLLNPRLVSKVAESVKDVVKGHAEKGELVLTLGGDHSLVRIEAHRESHF